MVNQQGIQGCSIAEHDISAYIPYDCFKLSRFAFKPEDLDNLFKLIKECTELNDIDINKLLEEVEIQTEEYQEK